MKTTKNNSILILLSLLSIFLISENVMAGNYTWNGATSTAWTTATNWTPNGVPGTNDTITIVTGSNNVYLASSLTVKQITVSSGTLDLQSYTLTISGTGNFNSGNINNGSLVVYGTSTQTFKGTQFGAKVKVTGNSILLNGSIFNDSLFVVKKGTSNDNGKGNNTFNGYVSLTDSASGNLVLSDSFPDIFNSLLEVNKRSTGLIYLAHRGTGNQFNGDVTFNGGNVYSNYYGTATYSGNIVLNGNVYFGYGGGSCVLSTGKTMSIGTSGISAGWLYFKNFTQQDSTSKISLALTGTSQLFFESGSTFNDSVTASAPLLYLNGSRFNGVANLTNNGGSSVTSSGGCYFKKKVSIFNSCSTSITYAFSSTTVDTFATDAFIQNNIGTLAFSRAVFLGAVTLKNANTTTGSDRYFVSSAGQIVFKGAVTIDNTTSGMVFGNTSGTITMDSSASLSFASGFTGNITLKGITQLGSSSQNFTFPSASSKLMLGPGNTFNGPFTYYGHYIQLNGSTFNSSANITRYGTSNDVCAGGNVFNGTTVLKDSSGHSNSFILANVNSDDFNSDVTFIQKGTGVNIYPSYTKNSNFSGNIQIDASNSAIIFGNNGGRIILDGIQDQVISQSNTYNGNIRKISVNKNNGNLILNSSLTIIDSLDLLKGAIISDSSHFVTIVDNGVAVGGSDSAFVQGPMKKFGNDSFVFPLGQTKMITPFHPMAISAPSSTSESFTATYIPTGHPNRIVLDSLLLSYSEYWKLQHDYGNSSVNITLGWNANSSMTDDTNNIIVTSYLNGSWLNLGKGQLMKNGNIGSISTSSSVNLNQGNIQSFVIGRTNFNPSSGGQIVDLFPFRGLYVKHFTQRPGVLGYISILGNTSLEDEILTFAQENNFRRLDLFGLYRIMYRLNDVNPNSPINNTFETDLCNFLNKARNQYCIDEIAGVGGGFGEFDDINEFNQGDLTPAYILSASTIPDLADKMPYLKFLENNYSISDGIIAKRAEIMKLFLRINDYSTRQRAGGGLGCAFDIMTTEIEFWNPDNPPAPPIYNNWLNFAAIMPWLRNLQSLMSNTPTPFRIHCYTDIADQFIDPNGVTVTPLDQADMADENSDKIYSVSYVSIPNNTWANANTIPLTYTCNPTNLLFLGINQKSSTIISPLMSSDYSFPPYYTGIGYWMHLNDFHTLQFYEKSIWFDGLLNQGNSVLTLGSTQWWNALSSRLFSANNTWVGQDPSIFYDSYCTNNVAFYVNGQPQVCDPNNIIELCTNTDVAFNYCSNYESGVKVDWDFGDNTTLLNTDPLDNLSHFAVQHHTYICEGQYTVTCTIHFRSTVVGAPCEYSFSRIVNVNGVNIQTASETICDGANATIVACGGTSYLWSPGGQTTAAINVNPNVNTIYTVTATGTGACPSSASVAITVQPNPLISITTSNTACGGGNTGGISISCSNCTGVPIFSNGITSNTAGQFSGLPAGTYNCSVTDGSGCSTSQVAIISESGIVATITGNNVSCYGNTDGSATINITGGIGPFNYTWTNTTQTTSTITALGPNTYTCIVTDANGCSGTATVVISQPTVLSSVVSCTNCTSNGSMSVYSNPLGGTSPYSYSWNNGIYTTQNLQNLTSGTYQVEVSDYNGCTSTGSITLLDPNYSCVPSLPSGNTIYIGTSQPSSFVASFYSANDNVVIHSDWVVNNSFTFSHSNVIVDPGVKITILPNCTLTVTSASILRSCTDPWQGIILSDPTSKLIINNDSKLRDAIVGVSASNSAIVILDGATFTENDVCVNFKNYLVNANQITILGSKFEKGSNIHGFPKVQGIVIQDATGPATIDGGSLPNTFDGLYNGFDIVGSDVILRNNHFINILCSTNNCQNGSRASIRATSGNVPTNLVVGGSTSTKCVFENCYSGVAAFNNVALDIQFNEFDNFSYSNSAPSVGVTGVRSTGMTQTISHNDFKYFYYGISLFDANEEVVNIKENIFNNFTTVITNHNLRAITVASTLLNDRGSANVTIESNLIKHHQRGIQMVNQHKANIISNTVYLDNVSPNGFYGIRVQNGATNSANTIISNSVTRLGTSTSSMETSALGISIETGTGNVVKENIVTGFGTGVRFYNNMTSNSALCNSLVENYEGITMESSNIGNQGSSTSASDNTWTRGTNTDAHLRAKGTSLSSFWYVQTSGSYYPNSSNDIIPPGSYTLLSASASSCTPPCSTPDCLQDIIVRIIKEQGEFYNLDVEKKYFANKYAFEILATDSSLMFLNSANDSIVRVFYDEYRNGNIDLMAKVKDYIIKNDSTNAEYLNSSITPENLSEENEKYFNQIYLETWGKYNFELDSIQNYTLEEIAYQNPISGGSAVYGARTILNLDLSDNIGEISERRREQELVTKSDIIMTRKLFPNPTSGEFTLILANSPESKGILEIYDIIGNLVQSQFFYPKETAVKINLNSKVAGLYTIKIVIDDSVQGYEKVVLQK